MCTKDFVLETLEKNFILFFLFHVAEAGEQVDEVLHLGPYSPFI